MAHESHMSEAEDFAHAFYYFTKALEILAMDADMQCARMGNYNVAWELKNDVAAGAQLLGLAGGALTQEEKDGIATLVAALNELPASLLGAATTEAANKKVMSHPCWATLRTRAFDLLRLLAAAKKRSDGFLDHLSTAHHD